MFPGVAILFRSNLDFQLFADPTDPTNVNSWYSDTVSKYLFEVMVEVVT